MDEDADLFLPPWEDQDAARLPSAGRPGDASRGGLIPLARAQDTVARLEASVAAAPDDLALRDTNLTGPTPSPRSPAGSEKNRRGSTAAGAGEGIAEDHLVAQVLAYARHWRRHGYGRGCALAFWAAPVSRINALARQGWSRRACCAR